MVAFYWSSPQDANPAPTFALVLSIATTIATIILAELLRQSDETTWEPMNLYYYVVTYLLLPMVSSLLMSAILLVREFGENQEFEEWRREHPVAYIGGILASAFSPGHLTILSSHAFGLRIFYAPLSKDFEHQCERRDLVPIIIGDIPLLLLVALIISKASYRPLNGSTLCFTFTLAKSLFALLRALAKLYQRSKTENLLLPRKYNSMGEEITMS